MNQTMGSDGFSKGTNFTRSSLGLKNGGQMVFFLPDKGISPYELISSPEQIKSVFEEGEDFHGEAVWKIPKFNFDSKFKFKDQLEALGVKLALEPSADMILDSPFIYGITASNGSLLFIGICTNPAE